MVEAIKNAIQGLRQLGQGDGVSDSLIRQIGPR